MTRRRVGAARLSALLTAAIVTGVAAPAAAEPTTTTAAAQKVPDGGVLPVPNGPLQLPYGVPAAGGTMGNDLAALAAQLNAIQTEVSVLAEQLNELKQAVSTTTNALIYAQYEFAEAENRLAKAKKALASAASDAYVQSGGLPNLGLGGLAPRADDPVHDSSGAAHELALAKAEYERTKTALETAQKNEAETKQRFATTEVSYNQRSTAMLELKTRNAAKVAQILRQQEAAEQALGQQYLNTDALSGFKASPKALAAVNFALKQLGKSYVWGAEGPDHYDCSGLMWAAYRSTGHTLPRVSRDQYQGTKDTSVSRYALLPGDLLFFGEDPNNPASIHHVGMYLGNGKMIHSPTTGDVVKISNVWWSHFFGATRVYAAIKVPTTSPTPTRTTTPTTTPSSSSPSATTSPTTTSPSPTQTTPSPDPTTNSPTPVETSDSPTPNETTAGTEETTSPPNTQSAVSTEPTPTPTP
ncbi:NlpC/P60 family protein [Hamadaea sp. NPDC050747]|uniref:C40 family peptidase n=1 Tax=Hamadaea sp. NPDC050747 TaxID=3155789 RepID=UPI0033DCEE89